MHFKITAKFSSGLERSIAKSTPWTDEETIAWIREKRTEAPYLGRCDVLYSITTIEVRQHIPPEANEPV